MADYFESGFTVRTRSWHGKETVLAEAPENWDDARMAAGLMWEPKLTPLYRKDPETGEFVPAEGAQLVERDDTNAPLGVVSGSFELITHAEMGGIIETLLGQENVKLDTAGSVRGGKQVYAVVLLDEPYEIKGDVDGFGDKVLTLPYFAVLNSHDGSGACKGLYTQVRVVCANTVQAADADGDRHGAQFQLRHTTGAKARLDEIKEIVAGARAEALRWRTIAEALAATPVDHMQQLQFMDAFIPRPPAGVISDRVALNIEADRARFMHLLTNSATNSGIQFTGLGLLNAATEYLDHVRGHRNKATLVGRQLLRPEPLKAKALELIREIAR